MRDRLRGVEQRGWRRTAAGLYPTLLAVYPVLFLYQHNADEVFLSEALSNLFVVGGGVLVVTLIFQRATRQPERTAVPLAVLTLVVFWYEHLRSVVDAASAREHAELVLVAVLFILVTAAVLFAVRVRMEVVAVTSRRIGIVSLCLTAVVLVPTIAKATPQLRLHREVSGFLDEQLEPLSARGSTGPVRDIYIVVPDRYPSGGTLTRDYGFDNWRFLARLADLGFKVQPQAAANYPSTTLSLASTLNLQHLDGLARRFPEAADLPFNAAIQRSVAARFLAAQGYEYHHFGFWWEPTRTSPLADQSHTSFAPEFGSILWRSTLLGRVSARGGDYGIASFDSWRDQYRDAILRTFEALKDVADDPDRTFAFVHLPLPHPPFLFSASGAPVSEDEELARSRRENFVDQLRFTNELLTDWLEMALAVPEADRPIIILQADEGPHPERMLDESSRPSWAELSDEELKQKFHILSAWLLPGTDAQALSYEDMSPVNTFRTILNLYFGADLPAEPAKSFVPQEGQAPAPGPFVEVTSRLGL